MHQQKRRGSRIDRITNIRAGILVCMLVVAYTPVILANSIELPSSLSMEDELGISDSNVTTCFMYSDEQGAGTTTQVVSDMPFLVENGGSFTVDGIETFADNNLGWVSLRFTYLLEGDKLVPGITHGMDLFDS